MSASLQDWCDQLHAVIVTEDRAGLVQLCQELRAQNPGAAHELSLAISAAVQVA